MHLEAIKRAKMKISMNVSVNSLILGVFIARIIIGINSN